jgi:hypothetical protein
MTAAPTGQMFDRGLRRVRPMMDRLFAVAMREVGMVRAFS